MIELVIKEPDKAYVADRLWLPRSMVREDPIRNALSYSITAPGGQQSLRLWENGKDHIICPREFILTHQYPNYRFPFVDCTPEFDTVEFEDLVTPRDEDQARAWSHFAVNDRGILNLACGKGKTKLALKKIANRRTPTLVIVPDGGIMSQWKQSILGDPQKGLPPFLRFNDRLGIIDGDNFDWKHHVTIALVSSLWPKIERGELSEEIYRYFGQIIFDECHLIGAPKFSLTSRYFYGDRIGLTATVQREDGLDAIYRYNIGEVFYSDLRQDLIPEIYFQKTPCTLDSDAASINGITNVSLLRSMLGNDLAANTYRYWTIKSALDSGRKILCLSHSKDQLRRMHAMFPGSSLIVGETDQDIRMDVLRESQICFAIAKLGSTGVDDDALDTLFWLTPFKSKNSLQQGMGRIQRRKEGKKTPIMVVFEDWSVPSMKRLCQQLKSSLKEWGLEFQVINPEKLPRNLPAEVLRAHQSVQITSPERSESEED